MKARSPSAWQSSPFIFKLGARSINTNQNIPGSCCPCVSTSRSVCMCLLSRKGALWDDAATSHWLTEWCCWAQRVGGVCLCWWCCEARWRKLSVLPSTRALTVFFSLYSYACASPHKLFAPPITHSLKFPFAHTCGSLTTFNHKTIWPVNDQYLK